MSKKNFSSASEMPNKDNTADKSKSDEESRNAKVTNKPVTEPDKSRPLAAPIHKA